VGACRQDRGIPYSDNLLSLMGSGPFALAKKGAVARQISLCGRRWEDQRFELTEPETPWDPKQPVSSPTALSPSHTLLASLSSAHGVADINSVSFAPAYNHSPSGAAKAEALSSLEARSEEVNEDEERAKAEVGHLLASCADDGTVRVWLLPSSPWYASHGKDVGPEGEVLE